MPKKSDFFFAKIWIGKLMEERRGQMRVLVAAIVGGVLMRKHGILEMLCASVLAYLVLGLFW